MSVLVVAALSARLLAEAAVAEGFRVVALDVFGDVDTRRAASQWLPIGAPGRLQIDASALCAALQSLACDADVIGWIAGSGFEADPGLLAEGEALLPLIGVNAAAVQRLRSPHGFFDALAASGIRHPPVAWRRPPDPRGWLLKDMNGCGGWHVRRLPDVADGALLAHQYLQREVDGMPMSLTFVGNALDIVALGFNEMIVGPIGLRPFVYHGVLGPVAVAPGVAAQVIDAARALTREFGLAGLCSLDFLLHDETVEVLEINPRPPASVGLYAAPGRPGADGPIAAHVRACRDGLLPAPLPAPAGLCGVQTVFAPAALTVDAARAARLADRADCHDLPQPGAVFERGDPLCSVATSGADPTQVRERLGAAREAVFASMEF